MKKNSVDKTILIVVSHPRKDSLTQGIKEAVIRGVNRTGAKIILRDLYKEGFNPLLYSLEENDNDPVTRDMQNDIGRADGFIFVTPMWWANIPAMLKGYFDRVFTEEFAFKYNQAGMPVGLLENKKALLLGTCDTPPLIARLAGTVLGFRSVIKGVLKLCGVKNSKYKLFGSVLKSTGKKREKWLAKAETIGQRFAAPESAFTRFKQTVATFIKAVRLSLFSFVFSLILLGSAIGASKTGHLNWQTFLLAMFIGLCGHAAVSLSNEAADEKIDRVNANRTMFNGGTGLLAKGHISKRQLHAGWIVSAFLAMAVPVVLVVLFSYHWLLPAVCALALLLGIQYSLPPLRLSRFGLGELAAFIAYGIPMMLIGFILQTDTALLYRVIGEFRFLLVPIPISLTVLVTLCVTQVPDTEADKSAGKRSISVLIGPANVFKLSTAFLFLCILLFLLFIPLGILPVSYSLAASVFPLVTGLVILTNPKAYKIPAGMTMINIMGLAATSAVFSGIIPAIYFFSTV
jgi:putative NADPH-quinone reductase/1,4-dihydroxy-2-naphthoate octaprenyltransferase